MLGKVSVVVPVYNVSKYLHRCLDSVLNQTFKDFECICINDGSTDNSLDILEEYKKKDKRIIIISQKNGGLSAARNTGIKHSKGEYITFLDSDDFLKNDYIEQFIKAFSEGDYDMILGGYIKYTEKSESNVFVRDDGVTMFFHTPVAGRIFKTSIIKDNNLLFPVGLIREDAYFSTSFYNLTNQIKIIPYAGYYYFIENQTSLSHTTMKKFEPKLVDRLNVMKEIKPMDQFHKECKEYSIIKAAITYLLYAGRSEKYQNFMDEYKKIIGWLDKNINKRQKNKYISLFNKGEFLTYRIAIRGFVLIIKLRLVNLFARIRCFGN